MGQKEAQHLLRRTDAARVCVAACGMATRPRMACAVQHPVLGHHIGIDVGIGTEVGPATLLWWYTVRV